MTPDERQQLAAVIERLDNYYDFSCEGGPLKNCVEWQQLKALLPAAMTPRQDLAAVINKLQRAEAALLGSRGLVSSDTLRIDVAYLEVSEVLALLLAEAQRQEHKEDTDTRVEAMGNSTDNPTASEHETTPATVTPNQVSNWVYYVVWPGDPEATGPYRSSTGRIDIFSTKRQAESFWKRNIADPDAKVFPVTLRAVGWNQPRRGLRGDPAVPRTVNADSATETLANEAVGAPQEEP